MFTKHELSKSTKDLLQDYAVANAPKERRSSLELCGLATTKDVRQLESQLGDNFRGPRGRRMSVPVLPSQYKPKFSSTGTTGSKARDTNDIIPEQEPTDIVYTPKEKNARTELGRIKRELRMVRARSINELRINGNRKSNAGRYHSDVQGSQDLSLEEQFEALRLCRYLRQPGHELRELDAKEIFKGN